MLKLVSKGVKTYFLFNCLVGVLVCFLVFQGSINTDNLLLFSCWNNWLCYCHIERVPRTTFTFEVHQSCRSLLSKNEVSNHSPRSQSTKNIDISKYFLEKLMVSFLALESSYTGSEKTSSVLKNPTGLTSSFKVITENIKIIV